MQDRTTPAGSNPSPGVAGVVERNIRSLVLHRRQEEGNRTRQQRIADAIGRFTGSMPFAYIHLAVFGFWVAVNLGWIHGLPRFDPTFVVLAMVASVEALFLSTFVLITKIAWRLWRKGVRSWTCRSACLPSMRSLG